MAINLSFSVGGFGQSTEVQQLLLNVEKLTQLKSILTDMEKGYNIISKGYNAVKDISHGNFSLHEAFLDGLMMVSPEVRKYIHVADIIAAQKNMVMEHKSSIKNFKASNLLNEREMDYISQVYSNLLSQSLENLDELTLVLTAGKLRMSDEERLTAIDRIFIETSDKLLFLRHFNQEAAMLVLQRGKAKSDIKTIQQLFNSK